MAWGCFSQESQGKLVKELSFDESKNIVMKECDHNKSPGLDGLLYEFYQVTWNIIGEDFVQVLRVHLQTTRLCSKVDGCLNYLSCALSHY